MKSWEFLIQKEGDRQWVPIPTPTLELEPGIYRIMANSNRVDSDVEVRITHQTLTEDNSPHDPQKYSRHVNQQGLMMVLPFTELSAGIWEIRCCGDIMSELLGENWREILKLQVLDTAINHSRPDAQIKSPRDVAKKGLIEDNNEFNHINNPCINTSSNNQAQFYLEQLEQLVRQKVEPLLNNHRVNFQQSSESFVRLFSPEEVIAPTLQLILNKDIFHRKLGESVSISGKIEVEDTEEDFALAAKLCYQLKHPHTQAILMKVECPLSNEILPYTFNQTLVIPDELEGISYVLGEVLLETITGVSITHYPFKIYSSDHHPVSYTIELFHTEHQASYKFDFEVTEKTEAVSTTLELPTPPKSRYPLTSSVPRSRQVLPPKLKRYSTSSDKKSLELPQVVPN